MSSPSYTKDSRPSDEERERRLADLSGAMALARLTHQVKELELQKSQQDKLAKPTFSPINVVIDTGALLALDSVKRWTGEGGVNVIVPLTVLDELDKSKKGSEPVNVKTREVIRYLDRRTKNRPARAVEASPSGSLRIQTPEEMFQDWKDCEELSVKKDEQALSKYDIPRYLRAMTNCVLFQRSKGNEMFMVTEDAELIAFVERWDIKTMTMVELDATSSEALAKYHKDMKAYEARKRTASRSNPPTQRKLWTPQK